MKIEQYAKTISTWSGILALLLWTGALHGETASEWTPGAFNPDWPHVIAAEVEGQYKPMLGWKFANDEPGDFSVVPVVPAEDVVLGPTNGPNVTIPAPAESLPISAIPAWQEMFGALDVNNPIGVVPGHWIDVVESDRIVELYIQVQKAYYGRKCSYSDFRVIRRELERTATSAESSLSKEVKRAIDRQYGDSEIRIPDVTGIKTLEFKALDERSFQWTFMRFQTEKVDDKFVKSITITSSIGMWANQNFFLLGVGTTTINAETVEDMAAEITRRVLLWAEAVYAANGLTGEVPDEEGYPRLASNGQEEERIGAIDDEYDNAVGWLPKRTRASERARVGGRNLGFFANYALLPLFDMSNAKVHPLSFGFSINF